ncbi:autotransporter-associated beta strand repeat-containing protein [Prosthecobacter sp.]|uniref:autotransporter-associated beta strand repeat-containing protein n=1 Tax=Prosthecobacter sp. TaxID=1965333 RepID=UPI0024891B6C|nr:autotransporter-associated beta strand repeat-containing protein [Prosthecobacter sp.]MDI1311057.1 autotransporter-associated beta strand repeat-containing protein [Prosthecobacter sp.]
MPSFSKTCLALACTLSVLLISTSAQAADRIKANNTTNLNNAGSWSPGVPDFGNMAVWTNVVTGANSTVLGGNVTWQGIRIADPGGLVTIGAGNTLTLSAGQAGISIDMSAATQDLTIQSGLTLRTAVAQYWNIAAGRTLTLNTGAVTRGAGATLNVQGAGVVNTTNIFNDATGIIGPWATIGSGTSARYAMIDGSNNLVLYADGTAAATAAAVSDTTGLVNYDVAAVGTVGEGATFNTLRYTGAAGTIAGNFAANGILTAGAGALIVSGNVTIGASHELVFFNGDSSALRAITVSGIISDSVTGSTVTKGGLGLLTLSGSNTYTGVTSISRGKLSVANNNALGSTAGGTRVGISGSLSLAGSITTAESIWLDDLTNGISGYLMMENIGTNTLTGAIRLSNSVRWQSNGTLNLTGGISTTNGNGGTSFVVQAATTMNITGKPLALGGSGTVYMDNAGKTIVLGVVGSTYGTTSLYAGTLKAGLANVFSSSAAVNFSTSYSASLATLDLNGFDQAVAAISTTVYSVRPGYDRVITSATTATLTTGLNNTNTTFDGRFTGAVSVTKVGTGTFTLTGLSTTTGGLTVNGGTVNLNFARAATGQSGAGTVSDYLTSAAPLTLGGGIFQLTGRSNGTATTLTNGSWAINTDSITVASTAGLAPGQLVSNANFAAGAYVVSVQSATVFIISAAPTVAGSGATISVTANNLITSQSFSGLNLNAGASGVTVTLPSNASDGTVLNLGAITLNAGATVNFTLPTGVQSATNGITTDTTNTNGILGGWARVGNAWAVNSTNAAGGNIVALTTYTDVSRLGGTIASNAGANVRIIEAGASGSISPTAAGTTDINTLLQNAAGGTATYDPGTGDVLRLGAEGGIMVASNAGALTLGASADDGVLTAGGAAATAGTLYLTNNHASNLLTVNSTITDNGGGVVSVTTSGAGIIVLAGTNTYTGRTAVGGGTLRISNEQNLGNGPLSFTADQLILGGGTLNTTASFSIDDVNRGITLAAAGGTLSVNGSTTLTVANVIAGTGILTQSGAGTLALTAANTYSGATLANLGTLALGNVNALQNSTLTTATAGNVTFTLGGANTYNLGGLAGNDTVALGANTLSVGANNETTVFTGVLTGTGGLVKVGAGTLNLTVASTYSGDTRIEGGMIVLAHANALQNSTLDTGSAGTQSANLTLGEGTTYSIGGLKGSADFDLAVSNLSVGANNQSTTFYGVLQGAFNNNVIKVGSGTLMLAGNNTYIGTTTVSGGSLFIGGTNLSSITVQAGAELGGEGSTTGNLVFLGSTHTLDINADTATALGSTLTGSLDVSALDVGGFTINITGIGTGAIKVLTYGSGGFMGDVNRFSLGTSTVSAHGAGGFIDNGIDAIMVDLGYLTNTWVGGDSTHPNYWDVGITANWSNAKDSVFQNGDDVIFADGAASFTPILQSNISVGAVTFTNTIGTDYTVSSAAGQILTTANGIAVNGSGNVTINSVISGNGGLTQAGTGITTLTAANTYTGATVITGGMLRISDESNLGTAPGVFTAGQITLNGTGATLTAAASFTINDTNRGIMLGSNGGSLGADATVTLTVANVISGTGGLTKSGAGTVSLAAANTYTGLTTVSTGIMELHNVTGGNAIAGDGVAGTNDIVVNTGGTLKLAAADQIADDAIVQLNGGTWNLGGFNETIRSLSGTFATTIPTLTLGGGTLTLNRIDWDNNPGTSNSQTLGDTGTLRFVADGATQAVFETNYLGVFGVTPGIQIDALSLSFRAGTYGTTFNGKVSGTGKLIFDGIGGAGGLTLTHAANDYSGGTLWIADSGINGAWDLFTVTASGALGSGDVTLQGGNQNTWVAGFVGTPTAFTFSSNTTQANHFILSGDATISAGNTATATATADRVTLSGDFDLGSHTLYMRGAGTGTISGTISGTGGVTKIDTPGTWVLTGDNTYTGATTVNAGQLQVGSGGAGQTGTGDVTVQSGGTLFGTGIIQGPNFTAESGSTVHAGDSTAASSFGTLNFTPVTGGGTQSMGGQVILDIGTANNTGSVDPTFGGNVVGSAGYITYVNDISRSEGLGSGSHDLLSFNNAGDASGYNLTVSGTLEVRTSGFSAEYGQIYNLLDWSGLVITDFTGFDVGTNYRDGSGDDASQFNLPTLSGGLAWDVSQFTTSGIIVVVPEPGRVVLILLGCAALVSRRRRGRVQIRVQD